MITAIYVVSPKDDVKSFASMVREAEYDGRVVHVGAPSADVRSVVFVDGSPSALKRAIANGESFKEALQTFRRRIEGLLTFLHLERENLRVFVHFGGQGEDEVSQFNDALGRESADVDAFRCFAISFGNQRPSDLFPNGVFTPLSGMAFNEMCNGLQSGTGDDDFENIRALRLLLACATPNEKGEYDVDLAQRQLLNLGVMKASGGEKHFLADNTALAEFLHIAGSTFFFKINKWTLNTEEFRRLLSILERTEI